MQANVTLSVQALLSLGILKGASQLPWMLNYDVMHTIKPDIIWKPVGNGLGAPTSIW